MARYRHFVNPKEPGITVFATTTTLDFVHAFRRDEMKDEMVEMIYRECRDSRAMLHAYVVMIHHVHLLLTLHPTMTCSKFMQDFKSHTSQELMPLITEEERRGFDMQTGLNRSTFWKSGFRGFPAQLHRIFIQKRNYIHMNPVSANLVEFPWDYKWSSARKLRDGLWTPEGGLPLDLEGV